MAWEADPDRSEKKPALRPAKVLGAVLQTRNTLQEPTPPPEGELSSSEELLRDSLLGVDAFILIVRIVGKTVKKDEKAVGLELLHMLSAYTSEPASIGIEAPTSEGKTYPAVQVATLLPKEDVLMLGGLSPTALAHDYGVLVDKDDQPLQPQLDVLTEELRKEKDSAEKTRIRAEMTELMRGSKYVVQLEDKILIFLEDPQAETWARLRPILSHDVEETMYKFTDRAGRGSSLRTVAAVLRGWPVAVYFRAVGKASPFWDQMATRFTVISPEMSEQKYGAAIELIAERKGLPHQVFAAKHGLAERDLARCYIRLIRWRLRAMRKAAREAAGSYNPNMFWIPFYEEIGSSFPRKAGRHMRDVGRFLTVVQMSAAVNVFARPILKIEEREQIIVTPADYTRAVELYLSDMADTIFTGVPAHILDFFKRVLVPLSRESAPPMKEITEDGVTDTVPMLSYPTFTRSDIVDKYLEVYGRTRSSDTIGKYYLPPLMNLGLVDGQPDPTDRRRYVYRVLRETVLDEKTRQLTLSEIAANLSLDTLRERWDELKSNGGFRGVRIYNYDGSPLTIEELHNMYSSAHLNSLLFPDEKMAPPMKRSTELAAFSKLGDYREFPGASERDETVPVAEPSTTLGTGETPEAEKPGVEAESIEDLAARAKELLTREVQRVMPGCCEAIKRVKGDYFRRPTLEASLGVHASSEPEAVVRLFFSKWWRMRSDWWLEEHPTTTDLIRMVTR